MNTGIKRHGEGATDRIGISKFLDFLVESMEKEIYEECLTNSVARLVYECESGLIEITMYSNGKCEVDVIHSNGHESPLLKSTITGMMPDWWSIHTEALNDFEEEREFKDYLWRNCRYW